MSFVNHKHRQLWERYKLEIIKLKYIAENHNETFKKLKRKKLPSRKFVNSPDYYLVLVFVCSNFRTFGFI